MANAAPPTSVLAHQLAGVIFDDGLLDLTIVAPASRTGAIAATLHLFQTANAGSPVERNDIGYLRGKQFKITTDPPQKVVVDGEIVGTTPIEVKCIPGGLKVFVPVIREDIPNEKLAGLPNLIVEFKAESNGN